MSDVLKFNPAQNAIEPITLTTDAINYVQKTIAQRGNGKGLRLSVKKTGCSGYSYVVDILDELNDADHVFSIQDGLVVAVPKDFLDLIQGTCIDYVQSGLNGGFRFDNPNQKAVCGCGESFTV
jgi:iron-sulfur cluster assembly protein